MLEPKRNCAPFGYAHDFTVAPDFWATKQSLAEYLLKFDNIDRNQTETLS